MALSLTLSGCAGAATDSASSIPEPPLGDVPTITDPGQIPPRAVAEYTLTPNQILATERARISAENACMARKGYRDDLFVAQPSTEQMILEAGATADTERSDLYGLFRTIPQVQRDGYHSPIVYLPGEGRIPSPADGVPQEVTDECMRAGDEAAGGVPSFTTYQGFSALPDGGPVSPAGDSRYRTATAHWADCMAQRGFANYTDPLDPIYTWTQKNDPTPTPGEIAVATADINCKITTNLIGIATALQHAYDTQYINTHSEQLTTYHTTLTTLLTHLTPTP